MRKIAITLTTKKIAAIIFVSSAFVAVVSWRLLSSQPLLPPRTFIKAYDAYGLHNYEKAERLWRKDLELVKLSSADINCDIEYYCTESWLGILLKQEGRYAESEPLLKHALEISKNIHDPRYQMVAESMDRLANLYSLQGRNAEAAKLRGDAERLTTKRWAIRHKLL